MANNTNHNTSGGRGFAGMDPERQREIASEGGKAAHQKGTAHEFDSAEAQEAGRRGGKASHSSSSSSNHGNNRNSNSSSSRDQDSDYDR